MPTPEQTEALVQQGIALAAEYDREATITPDGRHVAKSYLQRQEDWFDLLLLSAKLAQEHAWHGPWGKTDYAIAMELRRRSMAQPSSKGQEQRWQIESTNP